MTAAPSERRPRYDQESLLAVAAAVFTERGYDGTSMEDLARGAGITKSSIYHHVQGKEDLLRIGLDRGLDALFALREEPAARSGPAVDRLTHVVRRSVEVLVAELPYVTLLLRVRGNSETERAALARRRQFDRFVSDLVATAVAEGDLRPDIDPALTSKLVFGMINSIVDWWRPGGPTSLEDLVRGVLAVGVDGLRTRR